MKSLIVLALLMVSVITVNANEKRKVRQEKRAEKEANLIEQTKQIIEAEVWYFDATQMIPSKGQSRSITNYSISIKDGNLDSYLPYVGRAYSAGYGSASGSPLVFNSPIEDYKVKETKKGGYNISFRVRNQGDVVDYSINVSSNGSASLNVKSNNKQHISYYGNLVPIQS
ncbi:DUF4251 domain-containing protein [Draconibacterium sp. IB214405]|uniref:DUF4251 domain-containing protein n=1 Tax=Draconibacterium sp. IB214405 TaxID=3097352 RepID=UPI002A1530EB|nr:DUF4251 domain-containing protein [Draconibacterium sp. IB214405]MDX8337902.1 DUF4251 domain-containing protein [Draconibacterium sp. IB214405]